MTDIHIKNICAPGNLPLCQMYDVVKVLVNERLPQFFDACGIDLFANDDERFVAPMVMVFALLFSMVCILSPLYIFLICQHMDQNQAYAEKKRDEASQHPWSEMKRVVGGGVEADYVESDRKDESERG
ncbi:MAG TPA: hypothetical protein VIS72_00680 [Anaerolineales bacterium]